MSNDTFKDAHGHDVPASIYDAKEETIKVSDAAYGFRSKSPVSVPVKVSKPKKG